MKDRIKIGTARKVERGKPPGRWIWQVVGIFGKKRIDQHVGKAASWRCGGNRTRQIRMSGVSLCGPGVHKKSQFMGGQKKKPPTPYVYRQGFGDHLEKPTPLNIR